MKCLRSRLIIAATALLVLVATVASGAVRCTKQEVQNAILRAANELSPDQQEYERSFVGVHSPRAQREWQEKFQAELAAFASDPSGGKEKTAILLRLGFREENGVVTAPTYVEFVRNYRSLLDELKVPSSDRMLPAVVLKRGEGRSAEYRLVTPGVDPWPDEAGFRILPSAEMFNIPFIEALKAIQKGRFPLLEAPHDVSHFIGYLLHPEFVRAVIQEVKKVDPESPQVRRGEFDQESSFELRLFYTLEVMSFADPARAGEVRSLLWTQKAKTPGPGPAFGQYLARFEEVPLPQLIEHARKLSEAYPKMLVDYGGGAVHSPEKYDFLSGLASLDQPKDFLLALLGNQRRNNAGTISSALSQHPKITSALIALTAMSGPELDAMARTNTLFSKVPPTHELMVRLLRDHVARMEFSLKETSSGLSVEQWVREVLTLHPRPRSPSVRLIRALGDRMPLSLSVPDSRPAKPKPSGR